MSDHDLIIDVNNNLDADSFDCFSPAVEPAYDDTWFNRGYYIDGDNLDADVLTCGGLATSI